MAAIMSAMDALSMALLAASERSWIESLGQHNVDLVVVWIQLVVLCGEYCQHSILSGLKESRTVLLPMVCESYTCKAFPVLFFTVLGAKGGGE